MSMRLQKEVSFFLGDRVYERDGNDMNKRSVYGNDMSRCSVFSDGEKNQV